MSRRGAILPDYGGSFQPMPLDSQLAAASYYQRDKETKAQYDYQKQKDKQRQNQDALDFIGGLKVDHVGDNTVDLYNDAQIQKLQGELNDMQSKGADLSQIKLKAMQELPKIAQGYTIAKNGYDKIKSGLADLSKDYPTGKMGEARNIAGQEFIKDIFDFNDDGTVKGYKDVSLIPTDKDYMQSLLKGANLEKWYTPSGKFADEIKSKPLVPISGGTKRTDSRGRMVDQTYTGHTSIWDKLVTDPKTNQAQGLELKYEDVPLGKNPDGTINSVRVMPKDEFNLAVDTPGGMADFTVMFRKNMREQGIDPDSLDPRAYDVMQRKFAYDYFDKTKIHGSSFLPKDVEKAAPIKIYNSAGSGSKSGEITINDVYSGIKDATEDPNSAIMLKGQRIGTRFNSLDADAQKIISDYVNSGRSTKIEPEELFLNNENGVIKVYKVDDDGQPIPTAANLLYVLPKVATNIKAQADVKGKREVIKEGEPDKKQETYLNITSLKDKSGKTIKAGVKNGKWYNIETGQELK